jgi:hypothetical protein
MLGTLLLAALRIIKKEKDKFGFVAIVDAAISLAVYLLRFGTGSIKFVDWWSIVFAIFFIAAIAIFAHGNDDEEEINNK